MPIFECSRCNQLSYSASPDAAKPCERCGSAGHRVVEGDFTAARLSPRSLAPGDHATLIFDDPARIAPFGARYLAEGVDRGERVIAGVEPRVREAFAPLLGADVEAVVEWEDPALLYADFDPDRVASAYEAMIEADPRGARIIAGIDGESAASVTVEELDRYERLAHEIVGEHGATVVCVYDSSVLPPEFIDVARRRHGLWIEDGDVRRNERFEYAPV